MAISITLYVLVLIAILLAIVVPDMTWLIPVVGLAILFFISLGIKSG